MGNVQEGFKGYVDVWKMNTFDEINFQQELREQYATVQAVESQKLLQQIARSGGLGGGGGGGAMGNADLGNQGVFWRRWNNYLYTNAGTIAFVAIICGIIAFLVEDPFFFGFSIFAFTFAATGYISQATLSGNKRAEVFTSKIYAGAFGISIIFTIAAAILTSRVFD